MATFADLYKLTDSAEILAAIHEISKNEPVVKDRPDSRSGFEVGVLASVLAFQNRQLTEGKS